jgi:glucosamine--fructose-6-phosphate aminotransferase (isomerizing)
MPVSYLDGVQAQPDILARSASVVTAALAGRVGSRMVSTVRRGNLLAYGMGASTHAAAGFAAVLRAAGRPATAMSAADLLDGIPLGLAATVLAISQSGRSRETVEVLATVDENTTRLALSNNPDGPLSKLANATLPLGCGEDTAVSTLSYTASLQALGLLADRIIGEPSADWAALPGLAATVLDRDVAPLAGALAEARCVDAVASGCGVATAGAVGLLLREAAYLPSASFTTREYLHGPLETAGPDRTILLFGAGGEIPLAAELAGYGATVLLLTSFDGDLPAHPNLHVVRLPAAGGLAGCVLDILPVQRAVHAVSERLGRPIELRHMPADTKLDAS